MNKFVDPIWQKHAKENAAKGYPWSVWGTCDVRPLCLLGSCKTEEEALVYADKEKSCLRPKGKWIVIVVNESST